MLRPCEALRTVKSASAITASRAVTATISPSSSLSTANTMSVLAATMSFSQPSPAPWPKSPPEAAALMARVCWKPASHTSSQAWPQVAKRWAI